MYKATLTTALIFLSALLAHAQASQGVGARTQPAARAVAAQVDLPRVESLHDDDLRRLLVQLLLRATAQQPTASSTAAVESRNAAAASPSQSASVPDVGEFVLVRRDGKILFASVYTIVGSELRYVTPEGIRHTLPMAELDAEATRAMNEARGSTVQF